MTEILTENQAPQIVDSTAMLDTRLEVYKIERSDRSLGIQKMPEGYALILNEDMTHYYWMNAQGQESVIHWDKWAVRRMAINHAKEIQSNVKGRHGLRH